MHRPSLLPLLLAMATASPADPMPLPLLPSPEPAPEPKIGGPLSVACPEPERRCGAKAGEPCKRSTLGRRRYHLSRVQAAQRA